MNRMQLACFSLIGSAFVLAGLLAVQIGRTTPAAQADMVIGRDDFSLMTTQIRPQGEGLYVLDNTTGSLLIYSVNVTNQSLVFEQQVDLDQFFGGGR